MTVFLILSKGRVHYIYPNFPGGATEGKKTHNLSDTTRKTCSRKLSITYSISFVYFDMPTYNLDVIGNIFLALGQIFDMPSNKSTI